MSTLAKRVREAREGAGITQPAELARRIGVKPAAIYQLESGATKSMRAETALDIAAETGFRVEYLVRGRLPKREASNVRVSEDPAPAYGRELAQGDLIAATAIAFRALSKRLGVKLPPPEVVASLIGTIYARILRDASDKAIDAAVDRALAGVAAGEHMHGTRRRAE